MYHTSYDTTTRQWNGVKTSPNFNSQTSLGDVILKTLKENGSKVAQVSDLNLCAVLAKKCFRNNCNVNF